MDKAMAERKAEALAVASKSLSSGWTDEIIQQAIALATGTPATQKKAADVSEKVPAASKQARDAASEFLKTKALNDLTEEDLLAAKRYFTNRPISVKKGKPISVAYVSNIVHMMARFFEYAQRRLQWNAPTPW